MSNFINSIVRLNVIIRQINDDEIEIDIDALSDDTLFKLRKLLDDYMLEKQKSQAKAGQCEMEVPPLSLYMCVCVRVCVTK